MLRERALHWFIKWAEQNQNPTVNDIKRGFLQEFKVPQTNQQGLSELWETKHKEGKTAWELMQRFKNSIVKLSYTLDPNHQRDWFIKSPLPLTKKSLTQ